MSVRFSTTWPVLWVGMNIVKDKKHPHRWRKASLCRTADRGPGKETFKDAVMDICAQRGDNWASQVLVRVQGAVSDLHAADARYHHDCMARFMSKKAVERAARESQKEAENRDEAFETLVEELSQNKSGVWNSTELFQMYQSHGGHKVTRRQLTQRVSDYFGGDLLVLSSPGIANILMFQTKASAVLKVSTDDEDDMHFELNSIKKRIVQEVKVLPLLDKARYNITLNRDLAIHTKQVLGQMTQKP